MTSSSISFSTAQKVLKNIVLQQIAHQKCHKEHPHLIVIVAFLENATIGYSLESLCVCVCVCVCFCTITQKEINLGTRNRNTL